MKKGLITFILTLLLLSYFRTGYSRQRKGDNCYFFLGETEIYFSNNFIEERDGTGFINNYVSYPLKDYKYIVYGEDFTLKALRTNYVFGYGKGGFNVDSLATNRWIYEFNTMEFRIIKNGNLIIDWAPVKDTRPYIDSIEFGKRKNYEFGREEAVSGSAEKFKIRKGVLPYQTKLRDNDSLIISFRKKGHNPFLNISVKKSFADSIPYLTGSLHDFANRTSDFFKNAIEEDSHRDYSFYKDWPPAKETFVDKVFPESKVAYYFRKREDVANDSIFEYRVFEENKLLFDWKRTGNIIFFTSFNPGRRYRLDVRYADRPQRFSTKYIDVTPAWYQSRWVDVAVGAIVVLLVYISYLLIKNAGNKRKQREQKAKFKSLYTQLNPHFIFNALGSIQGLLNNNEVEKANIYLSDFGALLRNSLAAGEKEMIPLGDDIQYLKKYIALEQLRVPFQCIWDIDESLNTYQVEVLPLLLQPVVENAIKHGFSTGGVRFVLNIGIKKSDSEIIYIVHDNGKGFNVTVPTNGYGLRLVKERIGLFNESSKHKKMNMKLNSGSGGTTVSLTLKNWIE